MLWRALVAWLTILVVAILNGGFRQKLLIPAWGEQVGHLLSTLMLCALILLLTWLTLPWIGPGSRSAAWRIGVLWVVLTLGFEFLAGHYLFGNPWSRLLADYNLAQGRVWVLVPLTTLAAPAVMGSIRGLFRS